MSATVTDGFLKNKVDVSKLLKKIEELTLCLLEQWKEREAVRQPNRQIQDEVTILKNVINR